MRREDASFFVWFGNAWARVGGARRMDLLEVDARDPSVVLRDAERSMMNSAASVAARLSHIIYGWLRAAKLDLKFTVAKLRRDGNGVSPGSEKASCAFIIGCGRSGTSILGTMIGQHPRVHYLFEPYHLWVAIDPCNDATGLFHRGGAIIRRAADVNNLAKRRFQRLLAARAAKQQKVLLEKTPLNAMRLLYIRELAPQARFIHIVRDGREVCESIRRVAAESTYTLARRRGYNRWWGSEDHKWLLLGRDGRLAGYFPDEVDQLRTHESRAAYEWLVSLLEVDACRTRLGEQLLELNFRDLMTESELTLRRAADFLQLEVSPKWLKRAVRQVSPPKNRRCDIQLPPCMHNAFCQYQRRYGFD